MVTATQSPITMDTLRARREEILELARKHGASNVRVFGSVAKGSAAPGSDVDFLVVMDEKRSLLDLIGLLNDLSDLLGVEVDVATDTGLRPVLRERILDSAIAL